MEELVHILAGSACIADWYAAIIASVGAAIAAWLMSMIGPLV